MRPFCGRAKKSKYRRGTDMRVESASVTRVNQESTDVSLYRLRIRGVCRGCMLE